MIKNTFLLRNIFLCGVLAILCSCTSAGSIQSSEAHKIFIAGLNALNNKDFNLSMQIADQCIALHADDAKRLNHECVNMSKDSNVFAKCQTLNLVAQCLFIKFEAYHGRNDHAGMDEVCITLNAFYYNGYVWEPKSWPWKAAEGCKEILEKEKLKK